MPNPSVIFHSADWFMIPFSFLWGGFAIFWEASALGFFSSDPGHPSSPNSYFMVLWGIPFVVFGQYMIWGRFFYDAWLKRRTYYAVTNRRVLLLQRGRKTQFNTVMLSALADLSREGYNPGTLWLGPKLSFFGPRGSQTRGMGYLTLNPATNVLADIDDPDYVCRLILDLRDKASPKAPAIVGSNLSLSR